MRRPEYTSVFKDEINEYIDFKIENGAYSGSTECQFR